MIRIAINGFGRIGRALFRIAHADPEFAIVAINDRLPIEQNTYLLVHDCIHSYFSESSSILDERYLKVGEKTYPFFQQMDPLSFLWKSCNADIVIDCTGQCLDRESASAHLKSGAEKVVVSAVCQEEIPTFIYGVNHHAYKGENILSNASSTIHCLAPLVKILDDQFGWQEGMLTAVHALSCIPAVADSACGQDWRLGRFASCNIIPTSMEFAKVMAQVCPNLASKMTGITLHVPVVNGSLIDFTFCVKKKTSYEEICQVVHNASMQTMRGSIRCVDAPCVSSDVIGAPEACLFDPFAGLQLHDSFFKCVAWYDNEVGYCYQMLRLIKTTIAQKC